MRLHGWGDADVLALLSLFRKYLLYYVYTSDNEFVEVVRAELPGASVAPVSVNRTHETVCESRRE